MGTTKTFIETLSIAFFLSLFVSSPAQLNEGDKADVNNDGIINILDALNVVNHILEIDTLDEQGSWRADCSSPLGKCDGDGVVNILDILKIVNILLEEDLCPAVDINGNTYQVVKIGNQWWMAENLKVIHYCNGDAIPNVTDNTTWFNLSNGAYCNYANNPDNVATYGRLYNWYTVNDSRGIAPEGWRVAGNADWNTVANNLGGHSVAGGKMKTTGTIEEETGLWHYPNTGATNESGFSALPGGYRLADGNFYDLGYSTFFWSSSELNSSHAWYQVLFYLLEDVRRYDEFKQDGFSVRCVRDN